MLTDEQKRDILKMQARMWGHEEINKVMLKLHGITVSYAYLYRYNPGSLLSEESRVWHTWTEEKKQELVAIYRQEHARFIKEIESQPLYHKAVRLDALWSIYQEARKTKQLSIAAQALEQAAKEVGGAYMRPTLETRKGRERIARLRESLHQYQQRGDRPPVLEKSNTYAEA